MSPRTLSIDITSPTGSGNPFSELESVECRIWDVQDLGLSLFSPSRRNCVGLPKPKARLDTARATARVREGSPQLQLIQDLDMYISVYTVYV